MKKISNAEKIYIFLSAFLSWQENKRFSQNPKRVLSERRTTLAVALRALVEPGGLELLLGLTEDTES